jgi:hypothetical protein
LARTDDGAVAQAMSGARAEEYQPITAAADLALTGPADEAT